MKRTLRADEIKLWAAVASTVRPAKGRSVPVISDQEPAPPALSRPRTPLKESVASRASPGLAHPKPLQPPAPIEPLRKRRLARERDPIGARLDLHGLDQDKARAVLHGFLREAQLRGHRAVLVITGKGALGDGVLRRRVPEWLSETPVRPMVAGFSPADRRHGGAGALYIALKRGAPGS